MTKVQVGKPDSPGCEYKKKTKKGTAKRETRFLFFGVSKI